MNAEEILKKVRRIEIISRKSSRDVFAGEYHSAFKGRGMEFAEVREYNPGDDIRFIDWNVSSRMGKLYVKQFVEERELTVILAIDLSASLDFFSHLKSKKEVIAEISALIAFTASLNNDKVGLLLFTDNVEKFIPPKKGKTHILRIIREILSFSPSGRATSIETGLVYLNKVIKKKAIIFLLSDFLDAGFGQSLKIAARKHDLIVLRVMDQREMKLPDHGLFLLADIETGREFAVDFSSKHVRKIFNEDRIRNDKNLAELFRKHGADAVDFLLDGSAEFEYEKPLFEFFMERRRKFSH